jgi:hypothetical protein
VGDLIRVETTTNQMEQFRVFHPKKRSEDDLAMASDATWRG